MQAEPSTWHWVPVKPLLHAHAHSSRPVSGSTAPVTFLQTPPPTMPLHALVTLPPQRDCSQNVPYTLSGLELASGQVHAGMESSAVGLLAL